MWINRDSYRSLFVFCAFYFERFCCCGSLWNFVLVPLSSEMCFVLLAVTSWLLRGIKPSLRLHSEFFSLWTETFLVILTSQMMLVIHTLLRSLDYQKPASRVSSPLKSQLPQQGFITEALKGHNTVLIKLHREVKWQLNIILRTFKKEEKPCSVLKGCFSLETVKNTVMNTFYCNWISNINIKTTSELLNTSVKLWQPAKRSHQRSFQQRAAWIDFSQRPSLCVCVCACFYAPLKAKMGTCG